MMKSIAAAMLVASVVANPLASEFKSLYGSSYEAKPVLGGGEDEAMSKFASEAKPLPLGFESKPLPLGWSAVGGFESKPVLGSYNLVTAPIMNPTQTLPVIELTPIINTYEVPSSTFKQENIKQPITQPVLQPYLQRYVRQPQPVVQPIVNRVVQPVVHRQLSPVLQTAHEQAPAIAPIFKPTQFTMSHNQPIVGADLPKLSPIMSASPIMKEHTTASFFMSAPMLASYNEQQQQQQQQNF